MKQVVKPKVWAPKTIYLTRDGWSNQYPEDGEVCWVDQRLTKYDVEYKRVSRPLTKKSRKVER